MPDIWVSGPSESGNNHLTFRRFNRKPNNVLRVRIAARSSRARKVTQSALTSKSSRLPYFKSQERLFWLVMIVVKRNQAIPTNNYISDSEYRLLPQVCP